MRYWIFTAALLAALPGHAAEMDIDHCKFPEPPVIADGSKASQDEMAASGAAVRDFVGAMQTSLECLDRAEADLGAEITQEQKGTLTTLYNNGVDQMNTFASNYNAQVQLFKAR